MVDPPYPGVAVTEDDEWEEQSRDFLPVFLDWMVENGQAKTTVDQYKQHAGIP